MIEIYEDENKVYAENYHKIREVINRSDIQKANSFDKRNVLYRGYRNTTSKKHIFFVKSQHSYEYYHSFITIKNGNIVDVDCNCIQFQNYRSCKHLAAAFRFYSIELFGQRKKSNELISSMILDKYFDNYKPSIKKELKLNINISPIIDTDWNDDPYLSFKISILIGTSRMYLLNNHFSSFKNAYLYDTSCKFGKELDFNTNDYYFNNQNKLFINQLMKSNINLSYSYLNQVELANLISVMPFPFTFDGHTINYISEGFPFKTNIVKKDDKYILSIDLNNAININNRYIYINGNMYSLDKKERDFVSDLIEGNIKSIEFGEDNLKKFMKGILPIIKDTIEIDSSCISDIIIVNEPSVKLYFDINKEIECNIKFDYNGEIDYFDSDDKVLRNEEFENNVLNDVLKYGFTIENKKIVLNDLDRIVDFIENGLNDISSKYNIYTSENLKKIKIKKKTNVSSMFSLGQDNIMSYSFNLDGIKSNELVNILKDVKAKKKYYQLKNGDIVNLEDENLMELNDVIENMEITDGDIIKGKGTILKYRAIYLDSLKSKYKSIETNNLFDDFINNFYKYKDCNISLDKNDLKILRDYQVTGVKWLYNLDKTGFGGILADEMGLGKTIQVIYYIKEILKEEKEKFLIVVPTSLVYNWLYEFEKFGKDIRVLLIVGNRKERDEKFALRDNYDVIITTYGLLREDEEKYLDYYHSMIIDEAQNIKNYMAGVSKAVKKINAKTKFALTGTPIENSTLELWSIFDFIMPGYLSSLQRFQSKYKISEFNDETDILISGLNNQINPFILRRRKKDVIRELPEKLENNIYIDLSDEQKKLYVAELERVKEKMNEIMADGGINKARFMILQLLMKLRQICIDPSIVYDDYKGSSNKIETFISVTRESISNGHKILVFTSFKTALNIVQKRLEKDGIISYVIDGSVKSKERIDRVNEFNNNSNPCVFLIMLKSGGTGLNLTSADVVIHLDLWWNPQAENQATDRAHRIGQKNIVEVIKLITRGTIEEKILVLQDKKKKLSDKIIDGNERNNNIISSLTERDIKNLLSYENKDSD